jgi:uncharacterized protein DUF5808
MGSRRTTSGGRHGIQQVLRLVGVGLLVAAVVKELRTPAGERTWHGVVLGFVPYDLRVPTYARVRERLWAPDDPHLFAPQPFGVGWTVNVGRLVASARRRAS